MASTEDGAHQCPKILPAENMVPQGNLDISSWWTGTLQDDSILASADADSLQHIFSRLALFEAMPLGFTCRRLYYHFKESQKKKTKALNLTIGKGRPSLLKLLAPTEDFFIGTSFSSVARQFTATYASLRSLTVSTTTHPDNFATLLTQLSDLPLLTTLGLQVTTYDNRCKRSFQLLDFVWRPLAQLKRHPALRHLTVNLNADESGKNSDFYEIPPLPILRQLTSFTFVHTGSQLWVLSKVIEALRKEEHGVHLMPGEGACIGKTFFDFSNFETVSISPELLPYLTFLELTIGWSVIPLDKPANYDPALASLFRLLPQMRRLAKIRLTVGMSLAYGDYPSLLGAVSSLPLLEELFLEVHWANFRCDPHPVWPRTALPVLPQVRRLSLVLSSDHEINIAEKLHLMHCFPGLLELRCGFSHHSDGDSCSRRSIKEGPQFHICGQELARRLLELIPEKRIVKRIEFIFNGEFYFSSLEDLMAESRRKEQLKVANRLLADRDRECAQLRATVELLKAQLAHLTDAALRESQTQVHSLIASRQQSLED